MGRQGLAIRGDGTEEDSNLHQLLKKAEEDSNLFELLKRKDNVYTNPDIQNEVIKLMGHQVLREIVDDLQKSSFLSVMADETTDSSNHEQVTLLLRHHTKELEVHEEFVGLYHTDSIDAVTITLVIKDVLIRLNLPFEKLGIFQKLKETLPVGNNPGIIVLCPTKITRWTVRAESLKSIITNYEVLESTWDEALEITQDTETKARMRGVAVQMKKFPFFFGCMQWRS